MIVALQEDISNNIINRLKEEYNQPLIIAHRGYAKGIGYRRNTLPAFKHAIDVGAHGIETDLRLTSDNKVVSNHDPFIRCGFKFKRIRTSSYDELVDFVEDPEIVPQFHEIYDLIDDDYPFFVQIKNPSTFDVIMEEIERVSTGTRSNLIVMGYLSSVLDNPLPEGFVYGKHYILPTDNNLQYVIDKINSGNDFPIASPYYRTLTDGHLEKIHELNLQSVLYTINNPNHINHYISKDVSVIYTDNMEEALRL